MKDRILIVNPALNPASQSKIINSVINTTFPTAPGTLAAFLLSRGIGPTRIIDEQLHFIADEDLPEVVLSLLPPRVIGLSVLTINSKRSYELADKIKRVDPRAMVVLGGIHPTVVPEEALACAGVDVVVRGEGEETFTDLVSLVHQEKDWRGISGISFRRDGAAVHNPSRPMIMDIDTIPPFPYHMFEADRDRYPSFGGLLTSRGCPHNCIFCSSRSVSGSKYRCFSLERVMSDIKLLVERYQQKTIWLMDDNIAGDPRRFLKLLDAILEARLPRDVCFHGSMRGDNISDEILERAKAVNFRMLAYGIETGCESLMKLVNKGERVEEVVTAIKKTAAKGLAVATTVIFGLPGETRKDRYDTMRLLAALPLSSVRYNILTPYPGTPVFELFNQRGEITVKEDWENFAVQYMWEGDDEPYIPKGNNRYELIFDTMFANLSFYLSFPGIKRMLKSSFAGGNVIRVTGKWYLSPRTIWKYVSLVSYLTSRFLVVVVKMLLSQMGGMKSRSYQAVRENLKDFISDIEAGRSYISGKTRPLYQAYLKKVFENVLLEKYVRRRRPLYTRLPFHYQKVPGFIRYGFQKFFKNNQPPSGVFPAWPIEKSLEELRDKVLASYPMPKESIFRKTSWPEGKRAALILTHDIEGENNWEWVKVIAETEKELGFRSSWNVVPRHYRIDHGLLERLAADGFEIGLHGYDHANKLPFMSEGEIRRRLDSVSDFLKRYGIRGFRSPSWLRSERLFQVLPDYLVYDCSMPDVDYISPMGVGGCCSVFPFRIGRLIELPTTLPYEFPVQFGVKPGELNSYWGEKIRWIKSVGGVVNVITHPDPFYGGTAEMVGNYRSFLESLRRDGDLIPLLPRDAVARYREQM